MTSERKFIEENVKRVLLKEYLKRRTERSGFGGLDIQRTPMGTRVTLIAERPGMVIGRKGETIKELTDYVQNEFKFDNPQIEVKEVTNPNLNPHIMAQKLASALERGWHFRRAGHSTVRRIMSAGAKGCQVIISGKLTGQRHRTEKFKEGHIKYCGETKLDWMHEGFAVAKKKLGIIGVKVQIMDPKAKLPDEIELRDLKDVVTIKVEGSKDVDIDDSEEELIPETEIKTAEDEKTDGDDDVTDQPESIAKPKPKKKGSEEEDDDDDDEKEDVKEKEKEPKKGRASKKSKKKEDEDEVEKEKDEEAGETAKEPISEPEPEPESPEPETENETKIDDEKVEEKPVDGSES